MTITNNEKQKKETKTKEENEKYNKNTDVKRRIRFQIRIWIRKDTQIVPTEWYRVYKVGIVVGIRLGYPTWFLIALFSLWVLLLLAKEAERGRDQKAKDNAKALRIRNAYVCFVPSAVTTHTHTHTCMCYIHMLRTHVI